MGTPTAVATRRGASAPGVVGLALLLAAVVLGACTTPPRPPAPSLTARGGTLQVLLDTPVQHWDPQRIYTGPEASLSVRMFLRTLTTAPAAGPGESAGIVPDLATTTGEPSDRGRTWRFTLVGDAAWQDGRTVTCQDVRYGVSRNFARDVLPGGPPYAVALLDIPLTTDAKGRRVSAYSGPYSGTGQAAFDRAVSCSGRSITFRLKAPVYDFGSTVSLPAFAPVRKDHDLRGAGNFSVFSAGPYMLEGDWVPGNGGRFVRTRSWVEADDPVRTAYPDVVEIREGLETTTAIQRIIDDQGPDRYAVTYADAPPALQRQLLTTPGLASRVTNPAAASVEYLAPNLRSRVMGNAKARQALAMATNRDAFVTAYGGPSAMTPSFSLLASGVPGRVDRSPFGVTTAGDPAAARAVLGQSGLPLPVPLRVAYRQSAEADTAFAALSAGWEQAGFAVTLSPVSDDYYATISAPAAATRYDVVRASWSADWPSGSTVLPPIVDSRLNLSGAGPGQDYGYFADAQVNAAIDKAAATPDDAARNAAWGQVDALVAARGGLVALAQRRHVLVHGSGVVGYEDNPLFGGYVDLARVQLSRD
ncbi:MAG: ABC transporter substrate-binding protein [Actinomycetota bacterium]|nr:ABC transporter substrate-binding protein [Actinomycetota bacterium]